MDTLNVILGIFASVISIVASLIACLIIIRPLLKRRHAEEPDSAPKPPLSTPKPATPRRREPEQHAAKRPSKSSGTALGLALGLPLLMAALAVPLLSVLLCCGLLGTLSQPKEQKASAPERKADEKQGHPPVIVINNQQRDPPEKTRAEPKPKVEEKPKMDPDPKEEKRESEPEYLPKPLVVKAARAYSASDLWRKGLKAKGERVSVTGVARVTVTSDRVLIHFEDDKVIKNKTLLFCAMPRDRAKAITGQTSGTTRRVLTVEGDVSGESSPLELGDAAIVSAGAPLRD